MNWLLDLALINKIHYIRSLVFNLVIQSSNLRIRLIWINLLFVLILSKGDNFTFGDFAKFCFFWNIRTIYLILFSFSCNALLRYCEFLKSVIKTNFLNCSRVKFSLRLVVDNVAVEVIFLYLCFRIKLTLIMFNTRLISQLMRD